MKFTTIYLEENKIEVFNSFLGKEAIKVNGEIVSEKFSIFGAEHNFMIKENGEDVKIKIGFGFGLSGIIFDLYRDNKPIVESQKNDFLLFASIFFIVTFFIVLVIRLIF